MCWTCGGKKRRRRREKEVYMMEINFFFGGGAMAWHCMALALLIAHGVFRWKKRKGRKKNGGGAKKARIRSS